MLPVAVSIADGIWAVATKDEIKLSKVCENKVTTTMRVILSLAILALAFGCGAHVLTLSIPTHYYQAEERFEGNEALLKLVGSNETEWAELWDPITKAVPQFSLRKMPR